MARGVGGDGVGGDGAGVDDVGAGRSRRRRTEDGAAPRKPRPGLPDKASVVSEEAFVSPKGTRYRILKTSETDPYDPPPPSVAGSRKKRR
jgi:hypothetical protein